MAQPPDLMGEYRVLLDELIRVYRDFEGGMTPPHPIPAGSRGRIMRFPTQDAHHAMLLKLAAMLNFLSGALILCKSGVVLAQGALERMADEAGEDVLFLTVGITQGFTDRHSDFLKYFWQEDFADFDDPTNSFQVRPQVPRAKVSAAIHSIGDDPSTANQVAKLLSRSYSGFVHAAAPHVMELYDAEQRLFQVESAPSCRQSDHERDLWNYMYRGATAIMAAAKAFGSDAHFSHMEDVLERFQKFTHRDGGYRRRSSAKPTP